MVITATYLYSGPDRKGSRPAPINIVSYEKTTIDGAYPPRDDLTLRIPIDPLDSIKSAGLSTSRPSSPLRHSSRAGSARGRVKRDD
jgi:solute carrier family 35 (UDP-sugar transporter), member A1/2/3